MNTARIKKYKDRNSIVLSFDYDKQMIEDIKKINKKWWDSNSKNWELDIHMSTIREVVEYLKKYSFKMEFTKDELSECIKEERNRENKEIEENDFSLSKDYLVHVKRIKDFKLFAVFEYNPTLVEEIRAIDGAKYIKNSKRKGWEINVGLNNIYAIKKYLSKSYVYFNDDGFFDYLDEFIENSKILYRKSNEISSDNSLVIKGLGATLRSFQKSAIEYALLAKKTFIADDMGCGKTIEALATYQASKIKKCLVVCPNSVKYNWLNEANKWIPNKKTVVLELDKNKRLVDTGDINIINYDKLTKFYPLISKLNIRMCIFDESHKLKNKSTGWSKTALELSKNIDYCLLLSGTPILNRPEELINQLNIIDKLKFFGGEWKFKERYCDLKRTLYGWDSTGASNLDELNERLRSICYIRRLKSQVIKELPAKQRTYIPIALESKDRKIYDDAEKDIANWIIHNKNEVKKFFASLKDTKDSEEKKHAKFVFETNKKVQRAETLIKITKLRKIAADGKLKTCISWVEDFMESDKKLVLFCVHKDIINSLHKELKKYGCVIINGEISAKERQKNVDSFQNDPKIRIIICNINAGGVGLTLTAASDVAFLEFPWTIADVVQAEDRSYRLGQNNTVNIYFFFALDTIDLEMIKTLKEKEKVINEVTDGLYVDESSTSIITDSVNKLISKY